MGNLNALLKAERAILEKAGEEADEGTATLVSDLIAGQEKLLWMLRAFLSE